MRANRESWLMVALLLASTMSMAQAGEQFRTLVINDQSGRVTLLEMGDKMYVDLSRLVQIAHGSISYEGNRIIMDLSCSTGPTTSAKGESDQVKEVGLSREFRQAAIEEISLMREWASAVANVVRNGYPLSESWVADYRARAQTGLATASATISTEADRNAFQLLKSEFEGVREWSSKLYEARKSMSAANYAISPDALEQDPHSKKIVSCARFLGQMLGSGDFEDNPSCH